MATTKLFTDTIYGTHVEYDDKGTVILTVASPPFGKHTVRLDLWEVQNLLAVLDNAVDPVLDITEFFQGEHVQHARRMADSFIRVASDLDDLSRNARHP